MFIIRLVIGLALAMPAIGIFNTLIAADMGQGTSVIFMFFIISLITVCTRIPFPSLSQVPASSDQMAKTADPVHEPFQSD